MTTKRIEFALEADIRGPRPGYAYLVRSSGFSDEAFSILSFEARLALECKGLLLMALNNGQELLIRSAAFAGVDLKRRAVAVSRFAVVPLGFRLATDLTALFKRLTLDNWSANERQLVEPIYISSNVEWVTPWIQRSRRILLCGASESDILPRFMDFSSALDRGVLLSMLLVGETLAADRASEYERLSIGDLQYWSEKRSAAGGQLGVAVGGEQGASDATSEALIGANGHDAKSSNNFPATGRLPRLHGQRPDEDSAIGERALLGASLPSSQYPEDLNEKDGGEEIFGASHGASEPSADASENAVTVLEAISIDRSDDIQQMALMKDQEFSEPADIINLIDNEEGLLASVCQAEEMISEDSTAAHEEQLRGTTESSVPEPQSGLLEVPADAGSPPSFSCGEQRLDQLEAIGENDYGKVQAYAFGNQVEKASDAEGRSEEEVLVDTNRPVRESDCAGPLAPKVSPSRKSTFEDYMSAIDDVLAVGRMNEAAFAKRLSRRLGLTNENRRLEVHRKIRLRVYNMAQKIKEERWADAQLFAFFLEFHRIILTENITGVESSQCRRKLRASMVLYESVYATETFSRLRLFVTWAGKFLTGSESVEMVCEFIAFFTSALATEWLAQKNDVI